MVILKPMNGEGEMKKSLLLFATLGVVFLLGANTFAQDQPTKVEVAVDFSWVHFDENAIGVNANNPLGGGGSFAYYPISWFGIKADFQGYTNRKTTVTVPVGNPLLPGGGTATASGNLFTYMFGPVIKKRGRIEPYGQVLIGGAHSNLYGDLFANLSVNPLQAGAQPGAMASTAPSNDTFALSTGAGVDIHINRMISIRPAEFSYLYTGFESNITASAQQHSFRYLAGVVFNFW
jgi:hypothetical protein